MVNLKCLCMRIKTNSTKVNIKAVLRNSDHDQRHSRDFCLFIHDILERFNQ